MLIFLVFLAAQWVTITKPLLPCAPGEVMVHITAVRQHGLSAFAAGVAAQVGTILLDLSKSQVAIR